jgi:hypothetical protein
MSQLTLFPDLASPSTLPIIEAQRPCGNCGCATAILGSSYSIHAGRFTCSACGAFLGWAKHSFVNEVRQGFVTGISSFAPGTAP